MRRVLLGFLTFAPLMFVAFVLSLLSGFRPSAAPLGTIVIISAIVTLALYAISVGYFLYLVQTDDRFDSNDKARWTFILLMWFPFAAISFWYQFVWRDRAENRS